MSWRYRRPIETDYDSHEEYLEACEAYDDAEDAYADAYHDRD